MIYRKSSIDEETGTQAQSVSHVALTATNNPVWGETLTMTVKEEEADQEGTHLCSFLPLFFSKSIFSGM